VQLSNPTTQTLTPSATIAFANSDGWFIATSSASALTNTQPLTETVTVNAAGLKSGVYVGSLDVHLAETNTDYPVEVLLIVRGSSCTPTQLLPVITNLAGGFQKTAGIPVPLTAQVVDDCGSPLTVGSVMAYFPGGDPLVSLTSNGSGQWSGTWMPQSTAAAGPATVGLIATSYAATLYGSAGVIGTLAANPTAPIVFSGGVTSSASFTDAPLAPGDRISIFGSKLATSPASNNLSPYPAALGGSQALLGGEAIPLQVSTAGLINGIVPFDLPLGVPQQLIVQQGNSYSMPQTVFLAEASPAVFTQDESGKGAAVILVIKSDGTYFENSPTQPATAGDLIVIYCTGLGSVAPPVPAQLAAPLLTTSSTVNPVTVTIGSVVANVPFAGLAPEFVSVYQLNAIVPPGVAPGPNVPLVVTVAGASSVPVTIAIK
jgi:uncharacterized protein (TIGR03437 family)